MIVKIIIMGLYRRMLENYFIILKIDKGKWLCIYMNYIIGILNVRWGDIFVYKNVFRDF